MTGSMTLSREGSANDLPWYVYNVMMQLLILSAHPMVQMLAQRQRILGHNIASCCFHLSIAFTIPNAICSYCLRIQDTTLIIRMRRLRQFTSVLMIQ